MFINGGILVVARYSLASHPNPLSLSCSGLILVQIMEIFRYGDKHLIDAHLYCGVDK